MKFRRKAPLGLNDPLRHANHRRPVTRREFMSQGFMRASATVAGFSLFSMFADPRKAYATLAADIQALKISPCDITVGSGMIPSSASTWQEAATSPGRTCWSAVLAASMIFCPQPATTAWDCPAT